MATAAAHPSYQQIQGLSRGLAILQEMNRAEKGWASISELSARTKLHRTTVRRILETLIAEGYIQRSVSDGSFRLTHKVRQLSDGFTDDEWIVEVVNPIMGELLKKVVWPSDLCTLDGDCMLVRETTHRFSPLSFHRAMIRQRLPMLSTAAGRAYFAFCGYQERSQIMDILAKSSGDPAQFYQQRNAIVTLVRKTRQQGFATNDGEWMEQRDVGALAVPLYHQKKVIATLNVVYWRKIFTSSEAIKRFLPQLQNAAQKIQSKLKGKYVIYEPLWSKETYGTIYPK